jgi:TusA-related sulfurtransferase
MPLITCREGLEKAHVGQLIEILPLDGQDQYAVVRLFPVGLKRSDITLTYPNSEFGKVINATRGLVEIVP